MVGLLIHVAVYFHSFFCHCFAIVANLLPTFLFWTICHLYVLLDSLFPLLTSSVKLLELTNLTNVTLKKSFVIEPLLFDKYTSL